MSDLNRTDRPAEKRVKGGERPPRREQPAASGNRKQPGGGPGATAGRRSNRKNRRPKRDGGPQSGFRPRGEERRPADRASGVGQSGVAESKTAGSERAAGSRRAERRGKQMGRPERRGEEIAASAKTEARPPQGRGGGAKAKVESPAAVGRGTVGTAHEKSQLRHRERRQPVVEVETLADLQAENERLLKEISLELASLRTVSLE